MKSNYTGIVDLAEELQRQDQIKNDYVPATSQLTLTDPHTMQIEGVGSFSVNDLVHSQIADRLNIPRRYYNYAKTVPGLVEKNVNTLFRHKDERRMVRTLDTGARAFLSDRYKPIDHLFVMTPFMETLSDYKRKRGGEFSIKATSLTENRLYVEIMFPNITGEIVSTGRGREKVNAGIALTNSEVGLGAFDVRSFIWWQWCSNGAIANSYIRKYHTGRRVGGDEEDYNIYSDRTMQKEMEAFQSRLADIFTHALTDDAFDTVIRQIQKTTDDKVELPQRLIKNVTRRYQLSEEQGERILSNMVEEGNMNRYGLMNGITRLAQEVDDADAGFELEKLGTEIITLKAHEWQELSEKEEAA